MTAECLSFLSSKRFALEPESEGSRRSEVSIIESFPCPNLAVYLRFFSKTTIVRSVTARASEVPLKSGRFNAPFCFSASNPENLGLPQSLLIGSARISERHTTWNSVLVTVVENDPSELEKFAFLLQPEPYRWRNYRPAARALTFRIQPFCFRWIV